MNWRSNPLGFSLELRCHGACGSSEPDVDLQAACQARVACHPGTAAAEPAPDWIRGHRAAQIALVMRSGGLRGPTGATVRPYHLSAETGG